MPAPKEKNLGEMRNLPLQYTAVPPSRTRTQPFRVAFGSNCLASHHKTVKRFFIARYLYTNVFDLSIFVSCFKSNWQMSASVAIFWYMARSYLPHAGFFLRNLFAVTSWLN
jgi:hypothetical protein